MSGESSKSLLARLYPVLGWTIGAAFAVSILSMVSLNVAIGAALLIGAVAAVAIFRPFHLPGVLRPASVPGRVTAIVAAFLMLGAVSSFFQRNADREAAEFAALKVSNLPEYMARLKATDQSRWLAELRAHSASEYLAELKKVDEEKWFTELEDLDPTQFAAVKADRIEALEARARTLAASEVEANLNTYKELAKLVPGEQRYQEKLSTYQAKWEAGAWERANCTSDEATMAFTMSKEFVTKALKAPRTAEFPWTEFQAVHNGGCVFEVRSFVDAQNSFGALIRTDWYVKLRKEPDGWRLLDLRL